MSNPDQLQTLVAAARAVVKADDSHELQQSQIERLRSAIAAASSTEAAAMAATVPAGYALVPVEPNARMWTAGGDKLQEWYGTSVGGKNDAAVLAWRAMLAAAPQAPVAGQPAEPSPADPLQGAADWLKEGLAGCRVLDIQTRLVIGYNRAKRLFDAAPKGDRNG